MMRTVQAAVLATGLVLGQALALPVAHAADVCADFGGAVEADGLCRLHETNPNYELSMSFPVDFPDQGAVDDFLTQTRTGFLNGTGTPNFAGVPYEMDMTGDAVGVRHHQVGVVRGVSEHGRCTPGHLV